MIILFIVTCISLFINGVLWSYCQRLRMERQELREDRIHDGKILGELLEQIEKR
jgi:flagellar biosynthesis protein FlhB